MDVEHEGERQRCGVSVSTGGEKSKTEETNKRNKGEGKKSQSASEKAPTAPPTEGKDQEMKDANAETGEQTTSTDVPMEASISKV